MERIEDLRKLALNFTPKRDEAYYHFYKSYKENESLNEFERYGEPSVLSLNILLRV